MKEYTTVLHEMSIISYENMSRGENLEGRCDLNFLSDGWECETLIRQWEIVKGACFVYFKLSRSCALSRIDPAKWTPIGSSNDLYCRNWFAEG